MRARASVAINSNEIVIAPQAQARLAAPVAAETVAVRESSNHPALWLGALPFELTRHFTFDGYGAQT